MKRKLANNIRDVDYLIVRTGLYGALGNKGSCLIHFKYLSRSFAFCCGHFAAGSSQSNFYSRMTELLDIFGKSFFSKNIDRRSIKFNENDFQIVFGDLNFRITADLDATHKMIKNEEYYKLVTYDELTIAKSKYEQMNVLEELPLVFAPTYKYVIGTNNYDFKKKRVPSW